MSSSRKPYNDRRDQDELDRCDHRGPRPMAPTASNDAVGVRRAVAEGRRPRSTLTGSALECRPRDNLPLDGSPVADRAGPSSARCPGDREAGRRRVLSMIPRRRVPILRVPPSSLFATLTGYPSSGLAKSFIRTRSWGLGSTGAGRAGSRLPRRPEGRRGWHRHPPGTVRARAATPRGRRSTRSLRRRGHHLVTEDHGPAGPTLRQGCFTLTRPAYQRW